MTRRLIFSVTPKDCRLDTFRCGGKGGQNVNKVESGVRWTHLASGAVGQSCDQRTQWQNKKIAWKRMAETKEFQLWLKKRVGADDVAEAELGRRLANMPKVEIPESDLKWEYGEDARR